MAQLKEDYQQPKLSDTAADATGISICRAAIRALGREGCRGVIW